VRVLHIGRDFADLRPCGLTLYSDALMRAQMQAGHEVAYFFAGRHYPRLRRPRLRRWNSDGLPMLEILSSPNVPHWTAGTRYPLRDLSEPAVERLFGDALRETRPRLVHVHELAGLTSSLVEHARAAGACVVMGLYDYAPLCATVRLVDADGRRCLRRDVGEDCARNCASAPEGDGHLVEATMRYELRRIKEAHPRLATMAQRARQPVIRGALAALGSRPLHAGDIPAPSAAPAAPAADYQRRRDVNVERLNRCDRLIAPSRRLAEIYAQLGVDPARIVVQRLSQPHLEWLRPRRGPEPSSPLTFVMLNVLDTPTKGSGVVLDAVRRLDAAGQRGRYRVKAFGDLATSLRATVDAEPSLEWGGMYERQKLDVWLADGDVGLVPSVWEESHGFVGIELIASGIPVIGSALGGIPEYVVEGETGWLNRTAGAEELAAIMARLIDDPAEVERLRRSVRDHRAEHVRPMAPHVAEVEALYREVTASR
jgi:glycosyltransferase involved in cell wall biosynthesis